MKPDAQKLLAQIISIPVGYLIGAQIGHAYFKFTHPQVSFPSSSGFWPYVPLRPQTPSPDAPF